MSAVVGIVMGSDSDWPTMQPAATTLDEFGVAHEVRVVSAHRMPRDMLDYGADAATRGLRVIIAGAGGAAHLPGMLASVTPLPVIGVPVPLKMLDGLDSLLSIVQMPAGVPVATVSIGGARNAGLLAVRILAASDQSLLERMVAFQESLRELARTKDSDLQATRQGGEREAGKTPRPSLPRPQKSWSPGASRSATPATCCRGCPTARRSPSFAGGTASWGGGWPLGYRSRPAPGPVRTSPATSRFCSAR